MSAVGGAAVAYFTFLEKTEKNQQDFDGGHRDFVAKFVDIAIEDDIEKRQRLARYFAFVTLDDVQKSRWEKYASHLENLIIENPKKIAMLKDDLPKAKDAERISLESEIKFLERQLGSNRANVRTSSSERCNRIHKNFPARWHCIASSEEALGVSEIPGPQANQRILDYAEYMSLSELFTDDDIPWSGLFVAWVVGQSGAGQFIPKGPARNANWLHFGDEAHRPTQGDIVILQPPRGSGSSGFTGFYVGESGENRELIEVIGGNLSNSVKRTTFERSRVRAYRTLPNAALSGQSSNISE